MPTDAEIITEVICGNSEAYGLLVHKYQGAVYGLCYHLTGNFADAQDLAQEAFIQAYLSLGQLRHPNSFAGWLRQTVLSPSSHVASYQFKPLMIYF